MLIRGREERKERGELCSLFQYFEFVIPEEKCCKILNVDIYAFYKRRIQKDHMHKSDKVNQKLS